MNYDVIIVGARVAGSSLAILLGRQGRRVLLVDRDRFPSDTLSTHLVTPPAVEMLDRLGALADVEASGLRRLGRLRTWLGDTVIEGAIREPGAYALCARRDRLDQTLIDHALAHPTVHFMEQTRVERLLWEDGRVTGVQLRTADGGRRTVHAGVVVGADGKFSKVAEWVGADRYEEVPALRPVYYAYYRNVTPQAEPAVEVFYHDGRIGFVLPMEPGIDCLALETRPEEFAAFRANPDGMLEAAMRSLPGMERRLLYAERQGPVWGTRGVDNCLRVPAGPGWALTGDAAMSKDPSTGTGIEDAFRQSFLLAESLGAAFDGAGWDTTFTEYHRRRDQAVMASYRGTLAHTRTGDLSDLSLAWLAAVAANPGVARAFGMSFPEAVQAPGVLPDRMVAAIERAAAGFAAAAIESAARSAA